MSEKFYSKSDSDEVRITYFESTRRTKNKEEIKTIVSEKEFHDLSKIGADMSRYETMRELKNRIIKRDRQKRETEKCKARQLESW